MELRINASAIKRIGEERILEAVKEEMFGLENPGFCVVCGADHYECEPDARNYTCYECGERGVFGAAEFLFYMV